MKHIYLNLKRFDIVPDRGGVNRLAAPDAWGEAVASSIRPVAERYQDVAEFAAFLPEAHLIGACRAAKASPLGIGSEGVHFAYTAKGGNFGAFTTLRTANSVAQLGCTWTLIGHCEERNKLAAILAEAGVVDTKAVNRILNKEILAAQKAGLKVLYCIGEKDTELENWDGVLKEQLSIGLSGVDKERVAIAYEPVWSIGPGKTPADKPYITKVAKLVKKETDGLDVVYGGGLKTDNAEMLASIDEIDGGLIALTRFKGEIGFYPDEYIEIIRTYLGENK